MSIFIVVAFALVLVYLSYTAFRTAELYCRQTEGGAIYREAYRRMNIFSSLPILGTFCWHLSLRLLASQQLYSWGYVAFVPLLWFEFFMVHVIMAIYNLLRFVGLKMDA